MGTTEDMAFFKRALNNVVLDLVTKLDPGSSDASYSKVVR